MKFKAGSVPAKGMLFVGCSFTWGQGLYFYSNLDSLQEPPPDTYVDSLVKFPHLQYMMKTRFARLVADHFDTYELVHPRTGGSNATYIDYWNTMADEGNLNIGDISHITFQLTDWARNDFVFEHRGQQHEMPFWQIRMPQYYKIFYEWLTDNNLDVDAWIDSHIQSNLLGVKNFLQKYEAAGVKVAVLSWPEDYVKFIKDDPWFSDRLISIKYKDKQYQSIAELMKNNNMVIKYDYENFAVPPQDHHPSKECHRVLADSIIEYWSHK